MVSQRPIIPIILLLVISSSVIPSGHLDAASGTMTKSSKDLMEDSLTPRYDVVPDDSRVTQTSASMPLQQTEPSIAINPKKPSNMIVSYNDASPTASLGGVPRTHWSYSTDGGTTWTAGAATLPGAPYSDPGVAFDNNGYAYIVTDTLNNQIALYVSAPDGSGDAGASWNGPYIVGGGKTDKPAIAIDKTGGADNGNIYIAWVDYQSSSTFSCTGYSTDRILLRTATLSGGVPVFSGSAVQANPSDSAYNYAPAVSVSPSGSLYVAYERSSDLCQWDIKAEMISRSDNGGSSFALLGGIVDGAPSWPYSDDIVAANAYPTVTTTTNGTVFVAWTDAGTGDMDIQSRASVTNGASWKDRVRVNNIAANDQFHPGATSVVGVIYVFYYSRQADPSNYLGGLYLSISKNGGASFAPNAAFSSTFSNPSACNPGYLPCLWGDYIGADATGNSQSNQVCSAWADSRDSQSTGDNDVNIYMKCIYGGFLFPTPWWWWRIIRPPTYALVPFPVDKYGPLAGISKWQAVILPTGATSPPSGINLTATSLPTGVTAKITPQIALPPFNATISLNFTNAQCISTPTCTERIIITASDGTNSTAIGMNETLSTIPYLVTDTNLYNRGDNVNLTGFEFTPNSVTTLKLDGATVGTVTAGTYGSFNTLVHLSSATVNGVHMLTATDPQSKTATTVFHTPKFHLNLPPSSPPGTITLPPVAILFAAITIGTIAIISRVTVRRTRRRIDASHLTKFGRQPLRTL